MRAAATALLFLASATLVLGESLRVDISQGRSNYDRDQIVMSAVKQYATKLASLSKPIRTLRGDKTMFSMPSRVFMTRNGYDLNTIIGRGNGDTITLRFATTGSEAFSTDYKNFLQSVFDNSKAVLNAVFGPPNASATVDVLNYDATISDRQALAGGYYVPNAPTGPQIRFPVYQSAAAAGVNFIHTLLLAYLGTAEYPNDAWQEGFVRAAAMSVARTPGTIPGVTSDSIEQTLDSLYDASSYYDWSNVPGLGATEFIAPNLLTAPLPTGGSTGGIFLLRHQMAGTAWAKVLAEYPGFIKEFNRRYQLAPATYQTEAQLTALGSTSLATVAGSSSATIEGLSFADWVLRQQILDTSTNGGLKLVPQIIPVAPMAGTSDFGVFGIILNAFRSDPVGNETLLSGTCYPIYWWPDFTRFFVAAQDDVIPVAGAYGSVVPNFPGDTYSQQPYRVAVDLPFQGKNTRVYLPAGAIATGANTTPNTFYGTLTGFPIETGVTYSISLEWVGGTSTAIPVQNFAFGKQITDTSFEPAQPVTIHVFRTQGTTAEVITRQVNKGKGPLVVDLRSDDADTTFSLPRPNKLTALGIPIDPYRANPADVLQYQDNQTLVARFNPATANYDLYPTEGMFQQGLGYFARTTGQSNILVAGRTSPNAAISVALQPGWNLITVPANTAAATTSVQVTTTSIGVSTFASALGDLIGLDFFGYTPDSVNPDAGTLTKATSFQPGKSYFVRALTNDGAVLVFYPSSSTRIGGSLMSSNLGLRNQSGAFGASLGPTGGAGFAGNLIVRADTGGTTCEVILEQKYGASAGVNYREDSQMAPGPGGLQAAVLNGTALFRDTRPIVPRTNYQVQAKGLVPGQWYSMRWVPQRGSTQFTVTGYSRALISQYSSFRFRATSTTMTFNLVAN